MMLTRRRLLQASLGTLLLLPQPSAAQSVWRAAEHPLNDPRRCLGWWLVTPLAGNDVWQDLTRWQRRAQTINVTAGLGVRQGTSRAWNRGEVAYSGGTSVTICEPLRDPPSALTLVLWAFYASSITNQATGITLGSLVGLAVRAEDPPGHLPKGYCYLGDSHWVVVANDTLSLADAWHQYAFVLDPARGTQRLYVDGVVVATAGDTSALVWTETPVVPAFGGEVGSGAATALAGALDDLRIYRTDIGDAGVQELYQQSRAGSPSLLAGGARLVRAPSGPLRTRGPGLFMH